MPARPEETGLTRVAPEHPGEVDCGVLPGGTLPHVTDDTAASAVALACPVGVVEWDLWDRRAGLSGIGLHTRRHTVAATTLDNGVPTHVVSTLLGHSSISVAVDSYAHIPTEVTGRGRRAGGGWAGGASTR